MTTLNISKILTDDAILAETGKRIARYRLDHQLTQADMAEQAGIFLTNRQNRHTLTYMLALRPRNFACICGNLKFKIFHRIEPVLYDYSL